MSLFQLPSETEQGEEVTKWYYQKIQAANSSAISATASSTLNFKVSPQGRRWFLPSRSYFLISGKVTQQSTDDKNILANYPPTCGMGGNCISSAKVYIGGTLVSSVERNMAAVDQIVQRTSKSRTWLDSAGNASNWWSSALTGATGRSTTIDYEGKSPTTFNVVWQPPLGFFQDIEHGLPGLEIMIELATNAKWYASALEANVTDTANVDMHLLTAVHSPIWSDISIVFMAAFADGPRGDDEKFVLNFNEWQCQTAAVSSTSNSLLQFDVRPETNMLAVATQDARAGTEPLIPSSRFLVASNTFGANTNQTYTTNFGTHSNTMTQLQVEYNGQMFPATPLSLDVTTSNLNHAQIMYENTVNTGMAFISGGTETLVDFKDLGLMYVFQCPKDGTSYATRVSVLSSYSSTDVLNVNLLLFAKAPRSFLVRTSDSMVVTVQSADVARTDQGLGQQGSGRMGGRRLGSFY